MFDWETASVLATAGGTLALAIATFGAVRSANRSARLAERSLLAGQRPLLVPSRLSDPELKVNFLDDHTVMVGGGRATAEHVGGVLYLTMNLRNVGPGIAILDRWHARPWQRGDEAEHAPIEEFRRLTRDIYIPPGETGFWQGAIRDADDPLRAVVEPLVDARERFALDVLYTDHEGGQRCISRLAVRPVKDGGWITTASRHWNVDRPDPR